MKPVTIGILASSSTDTTRLRDNLLKTSLATIVVEVAECCRTQNDWITRRFIDVKPEVIVIDAGDDTSALVPIQVLHAAIPSAWILVHTKLTDTETILNMVRAGAREVISVSTQDALHEALRRHIEERHPEQQKDDNLHGKIYTVCSAKPGCGATTMAINIAASIAESDTARVALLDLDWPLGDAAAFLNIKPRFTVADALGAINRLDPVLLESYMHKHDGVDVLAGFEEFGTAVFDAVSVDKLLEIVTRSYTHVVVDVPPAVPRSVFQTAVTMSSEIVAITTPDILSLRRTERLLRIFSSFDVSNKVRLVLNRFHRTNEITDCLIQKALGQPVTSKLANDYYSCLEAMNAGKTVIAISNKTLARNYREFAAELLGQHQIKRKGLLSLLPKSAFSFS